MLALVLTASTTKCTEGECKDTATRKLGYATSTGVESRLVCTKHAEEIKSKLEATITTQIESK